ncbi:SWIM zinc finger family protein [Reichenbachiella sp.]
MTIFIFLVNLEGIDKLTKGSKVKSVCSCKYGITCYHARPADPP